MFKPIQILNQYKIDELFIQDNRIMVRASLQSEVREKDINIGKEDKDEKYVNM